MSQENPYNSPVADPGSRGHGPERGSGTFVPQVRIVAILMIFLGVLEALFGIYFVVMGFVMPEMMQAQMQNQPNGIPANQQAMVSKFLVGYFFIAGGLALLIGVLRVIAGILGVQYRGRVLGLCTHIGGILVIATLYCIPTALALGIYGCVVYFNRDVVQAFRMRQEGRSTEEIFAYFGR